MLWIPILLAVAIGASPEVPRDGWELLSSAKVDREGVFLPNILRSKTGLPVPRLRLTNAPAYDRQMVLSRGMINGILWKVAPELVQTNWSGTERVLITRATRTLDETGVRDLLTMTLQREVVKERGDLELRLTRPWTPVIIPDDVCTIKIVELPLAGVSQNFVCRFEISAGPEKIGSYVVPLQARVMREVYVASGNLTRGTALREANISKESRDLLTTRDPITSLPLDNGYVEIGETIPAGTPLTSRSFRLKSIVKRGRVLDAVLEDPVLKISVKVEALEDGVPGQVVRVRNVQSRRELRGKVQDEQTVQVVL